MKTPALFFAIFCAASCGGKTTTIEDSDASTAGSDAAASDAASADARADGGTLGTACDALGAKVDTAREALTRCCATCDSLQCNAMVDDVCCPLSYTNQGANSATAREFQALVRTFKAECPTVCPGTPCFTKPSQNCNATSLHCEAR